MGFDSSFLEELKSMNLDVNNMMENPASAISSVLILMPLVIQQFSRMEKRKYFKKFPDPPKDGEVFDYIIVGGGTAGSVLANRLSSEANSYKVLVIEAGGPPLPTSILPAAGFFGIGVNETDWMYESTKQARAFKSTEKQTSMLYQGKGLGGTSLLSLLIHSRGTPKIYDDWASQVNDDRWNISNMRDYFKRSENYKGNYPNDDLHGCSGEFPVESSPYQPPTYILKAAKENNFKVKDLTEVEAQEYGKVESPIHDSVRYNAYSAFIEPVLSRKNLRVLPFSEVTKILFDSDNTKAIGVEFIFEGKTGLPHRALAKKEVILSAGALSTPKLLQISGIGPSDHLSSLKIPVVRDLPVGDNLQDIVGTGVFGTYSKPQTSLIPERDIGMELVVDEDLQNNGPLSGNMIAGIGVYSSKENPDANVPDIAHTHMYIGMSKALPPAASKFVGIHEGLVDRLFDESVVGKDGHFDLITVRPESRGNVRISGADFRLPPIIDLGIFSNPSDLDRLIDGITQVHAVYDHSKTFHGLGHQWSRKICTEFPENTYEFHKCWVETLTLSAWAYSGTCKMGPDGDPTAVTDSSLRVQGIDNLRVVDASVIPVPPNALLIPVVMAIAEQAADIIIKDAGGAPNAFYEECEDLPPPPVTVPNLMDRMISEIGGAIGGLQD